MIKYQKFHIWKLHKNLYLIKSKSIFNELKNLNITQFFKNNISFYKSAVSV